MMHGLFGGYGRIGKSMFAQALATLTDEQIIAQVQRPTKHVSKHRNQRNLKLGSCNIADNSSIMKRMRRAGDGFKPVAVKPARVRMHWRRKLREAWSDISNLASDLEKDRERRRLMRCAA